jgi:hypothetical protein
LSSGEIQHTQLYKKLKQIQEKIRRLNQTFLASPTLKSGSYQNKTQTFLIKSNKKLMNVSNSIAQLGKKLFQENLNLLAKSSQTVNEKEINKNLNTLNVNIENIQKIKMQPEDDRTIKQINIVHEMPIINKQSLDQEISKFLDQESLLGQQIDELERVDNKIDLIKNKVYFKSSINL